MTSSEEKEFPIAFILSIKSDLQAVEKLLKSIYQPQNFYCIHVDISASEEFTSGVEEILSVITLDPNN